MKKHIKIISFIIISCVILTACSAGGSMMSDMASLAPSAEQSWARNDMGVSTAAAPMEAYDYDYATADDGMYYEEMGYDTGSGEAGTGDLEHRKLIKNAHLNVETQEFDALLYNIEERLKFLGGYMETFNVSNNSYYPYGNSNNRYAYMGIRIPADRYDLFMNDISGMANVTSRNESINDVTMQYVDVESRKRILETEQERLLELMAKAETIEDLIILERRLSEVRYQLESSESQLRTYDNLVDYSSIYISIQEVGELSPVVELTVWERISKGFVRSLRNVGTGFVNFFVTMIVASPYLFTFLAFVALVLLLIKVCVSTAKKKKKQRAAPPNIYEAVSADNIVENIDRQNV